MLDKLGYRHTQNTNKHTHSEHEIHMAFPLQKLFLESASFSLYANFLSCWNLLFQKTYIPLTVGVLSRCSTHNQIKAIYKTNIPHFLNKSFHFNIHPSQTPAKCFSFHLQHKNSTRISHVSRLSYISLAMP